MDKPEENIQLMQPEPELPKKSLLKKFDIPINHLDFKYIETCRNAREMEKIVMILRSGEEGHFPDLMTCAEEKLKMLKPESKVLRTEEPVLTKHLMDRDDWEQINTDIKSWTNEIKSKDKELRKDSDKVKVNENLFPAVRKGSNISKDTGEDVNKEKKCKSSIASCDYARWDKFDADEELLKMELQEEKNREANEKKKKLKEQSANKLAIKHEEILNKMTYAEREALAVKHRLKGNEFFYAKEYTDAIYEYTMAINLLPTPILYNNRAVAYYKMKNFKKVLVDLDECLRQDPTNIKALIRKGQIMMEDDRRRDAYEVYLRVLEIDPGNIAANNSINDLKRLLPDLPPANAFRMKIEEESKCTSPKEEKAEINTIKEKKKPPAKPFEAAKEKQMKESGFVDCDFASLIVPNKIVKSKVSNTVDMLQNIMKHDKKKTKNLMEPSKAPTTKKSKPIVIEEM